MSRSSRLGFFHTLVFASLSFSLAAVICRGQSGPDLLRQAGVTGGVVVHLGCGSGDLTAALIPEQGGSVLGLETDAAMVDEARRLVRRADVYGQVVIDRWDGISIPCIDDFVNLIVVSEGASVGEAELLRALAPGGTALLAGNGVWREVTKPWAEELGEWTHYFHGPDGNPAGTDTRVGAPNSLQWLGSPAWARHHDHMASMTAMVSAAGRLFYVIDEGSRASIRLPSRWRLVARDGFNGTVLWKRDIVEWASKEFALKSGPAHLLRRLVAVGDRVYVTLGIDAPVSILDARTGRTLATCADTDFAGEIVVSGETALLVAAKGASRLPAFRRVASYVWANTRAANSDWGWHRDERFIVACDSSSGSLRWKRDVPVAPCSLAACGDAAVFHDGQRLVCLDIQTGTTRWESAEIPVKLPVQSSTGPRVLIHANRVLYAGNDGRMSGWDLDSGIKVWEQAHKPSGHLSLRDLFVVDGLVWTAAIAGNRDDGVWTGYDPVTGEQKREFAPDIDLHWFHHRCYPSKATGSLILTGRNGTEYVDLRSEKWTAHHWFRGGCIYGVMPCNGMTYAGMDACGCQLEAKLSGLKALVARPGMVSLCERGASVPSLVRGPAYGRVQSLSAGPRDWPMFRHDPGRSGGTRSAVAFDGANWDVRIGTELTAPTIAGDMVFVADRASRTVHALDAATGAARWAFTTGGQTDTPPSYWNGRVLFGSADGHVYCVRASDGVLVWRFRAAAADLRHMAWERLESVWPVHGSVLVLDAVQGGLERAVVVCTAGRSIYLDGGIRFVKLDAETGELLAESTWDEKDPISGLSMHEAYLKKTPGNTMPVGLSDILSFDGTQVWMRSQKLGLDGVRSELAVLPATDQPAEDAHLFCQVGFTDDSYFFRSYWTYGRRMVGGYGGWYQAGRYVPSGRILCFDDARVYGYGRRPEYMVNASLVEYDLFAAGRTVTAEDISRVGRADRAMSQRRPEKSPTASDWRLRHYFPRRDLSAASVRWLVEQPSVHVRAMCLAGDRLYVAGPPDLIDERYAYHHPDDPDVLLLLRQQEEAYAGRLGGLLWEVDAAEGGVLGRYSVDAAPVFDGLAAAAGRLYLSTVDGRVVSFTRSGLAGLRSPADTPTQVRWEEPEDPGYLLPLPEPKDDDFAVLSGCNAFASDLGYRLRATAEKTVGVALKAVDTPITGKVTFRTRVRAVPDAQGLLRNGYLAFGDGTDEVDLVKCGVRLQPQRAAIIQGPFLRGGKSVSAAVDAPETKGLEAVVTVDLRSQTVTFVANGVTIEAPIHKPLAAITHVGYVMDSALIDVAPVEIVRE